MDERLMAKRISQKLCPYCASGDIEVNWISRKAKCNSCGESMRQEKAQQILRRIL